MSRERSFADYDPDKVVLWSKAALPGRILRRHKADVARGALGLAAGLSFGGPLVYAGVNALRQSNNIESGIGGDLVGAIKDDINKKGFKIEQIGLFVDVLEEMLGANQTIEETINKIGDNELKNKFLVYIEQAGLKRNEAVTLGFQKDNIKQLLEIVRKIYIYRKSAHDQHQREQDLKKEAAKVPPEQLAQPTPATTPTQVTDSAPRQAQKTETKVDKEKAENDKKRAEYENKLKGFIKASIEFPHATKERRDVIVKDVKVACSILTNNDFLSKNLDFKNSRTFSVGKGKEENIDTNCKQIEKL